MIILPSMQGFLGAVVPHIPPTYVTGNFAQVNQSTTNYNLVIPPGSFVANDLMLAAAFCYGDTPSVPAGWTMIPGASNPGGGNFIVVWRRFVAGDLQVTFTGSGSGALLWYGALFGYRGCVTSGTPYEGAAVNGGMGPQGTLWAPAVTPTGPARTVVNYGMALNLSFAMDPTGYSFSNYPMAYEDGGGSSDGTNYNGSQIVADQLVAAGTASDSINAFTGTAQAASFFVAAAMALIPAA